MAKRVSRSIQFSKETDEFINEMKEMRKYKKTRSAMVEYLVENSPEFILYEESRKKIGKK